MKILKEMAGGVMKAVERMTGESFADVDKRKGLYVARPVLNGESWEKWATKFGIPNPVPAAEMHISILYSSIDVKKPPITEPVALDATTGAFVALGAENQCLCLSVRAWHLSDRNWDFVRDGAIEEWPYYRPHMTLSYDAKDFEISDEAMKAMPKQIILGGEVYAGLGEKADLAQAANDDAEGMKPEVVVVTEVYRSAAKKLLDDAGGEMGLYDESALRDIAKRDKVGTSSVDVLKTLNPKVEEMKMVRKAVERDVVMTVRPFEGEIAKKIGDNTSTLGTEDERQLIWGIASVTTMKGELVFDHDDDQFTTRAMEDFTIDLMKNQRAGKFEHEGEACNHIVQALVLSEDLQKALGFDLGYEPLVICTEVPDPAAWAEVKKGDWMFSIAGRFIYYEDQADA